MFARFGNPRFNKFQFNENRNDADSMRIKDFTVIVVSTKSPTTVSPSSKSYTEVSPNGGKAFVEVGG